MSLSEHPFVSDWLRVEGDVLVLRTGKVELGQRISTALARIALEEVSVAYDQVVLAPVGTGDSPDEGITSGSNSVEHSGHAVRMACATARLRALDVAARQFDCAADALTLADGHVAHRGSNSSVDILDLIRGLPADLRVDPNATPRKPAQPLHDLPPLGLHQMVEGSYEYVHDIERPGMLHARIICPPTTDARLTALGATPLTRLENAGIRVVRDGAFLAVAGRQEWPVVRAARMLANACEWELPAPLEYGDIHEIMARRAARRLAVVDGAPDPAITVPQPLETADFEARCDRPYTLHGALGPSAALATFSQGKLEIITHSQGIYFLRDSIADSLDMDPADVCIQHRPGAGCYGHNCADDAAFEAALIARALPDTPILLKYSRSDEHRREPLGTAASVSIQAKTDDAGDVASLWMEARGDTHRGRPRPGPNRAGAARLAANASRDCNVPRFVPEPNLNRHAGLHRNLDPIYDIPEKRLVKALVPDLPLRPSALRCLGAPANVLAIESMMDELAGRAGVDPVSFRRRHLEDPRALAVLDRMQRILADRPVPSEGGRGVSYAQYKNAMTRVSVAVDLTVSEAGAARLDHVFVVADAGRIVDPDGLRAQLEGGVLQGASWALFEEMRWGPEGRECFDWDSYPVLRFQDAPEISLVLIDQPDEPSVGAGEASPSPTIAAISNALFAATGLRLRRMPFNADAIRQAALSG